MTLSRSIAVPGMFAEYEAFTGLVEGLSADQWAVPTRCEGWTAADVAAHVIGQLTDVVNLRLEGLGTAEATARQVDERRGRTPSELAEELRQSAKLGMEIVAAFDDAAWDAPAPGGTPGTLGFGIEALWFDTFLHADDIRSALGRPTELGGGLPPSISHVAQVLTDQGWGPATLSFEGVGEFPVSGGGGRVVTGDPMTFVLVSTGRAAPEMLGLDDSVNIYRS